MDERELKVVIRHAFTIKRLKTKGYQNYVFSRIAHLMQYHPVQLYRDVALVRSRETDVVELRQAMCHIIMTLFDFSLRDTAILCGLREDHSTVKYHMRKHYDRYGRNGYETYTEAYDRFLEFISYHWDTITAVPGELEPLLFTPSKLLKLYEHHNKLVSI